MNLIEDVIPSTSKDPHLLHVPLSSTTDKGIAEFHPSQFVITKGNVKITEACIQDVKSLTYAEIAQLKLTVYVTKDASVITLKQGDKILGEAAVKLPKEEN